MSREDTLEKMLGNFYDEVDDIVFQLAVKAMKKYAEQEVKKALQKAAKKAGLTDFAQEFMQEGAGEAIDKKTILNAYTVQ